MSEVRRKQRRVKGFNKQKGRQTADRAEVFNIFFA